MQLIDAGMIAFAGWHALKGKVEWPLTFQVPRMLRAVIREVEDTYVLCWNAERLRKREVWPAYRDRPEIWEEAGEEDFGRMLEVLSGLGAVQYRADGWEADEVLAALVHELEEEGGAGETTGAPELVIRSDDKDFMQLLSGSTRMVGRRRGEVRRSDVQEILGVPPRHVADYLALAGDEADGIPRIVPPSAARELVRTLGHVSEWADDPLDEGAGVGPETRRAVEESREQLRLNLRLVDLSAGAVGEPPSPRLEGWGDLDAVRRIGERTGIGYLSDEDVAEEYAVLREWGERARRRLGV